MLYGVGLTEEDMQKRRLELYLHGYGLSYITKKLITIAVILIGYLDGIVRNLSNEGEDVIGK